MNEITVEGANLVILAIVVLWIGTQITNHVGVLSRYSIPSAVTGGLLCSLLTAGVKWAGGPEITFNLALRDTFLLIFFSTIGLSAKFARVRTGGKGLLVLVITAAIFLAIQDAAGVAIVSVLGTHPAYGLFAGSVSLAGGHGTAIAWGNEALKAGLPGVDTVGIAFATFGLVVGGIIGGHQVVGDVNLVASYRQSLPHRPQIPSSSDDRPQIMVEKIPGESASGDGIVYLSRDSPPRLDRVEPAIQFAAKSLGDLGPPSREIVLLGHVR